MNVNTSESFESEIESFENLKYSIADNNNNILLDDSCYPDVNFFNVNFENLNTPYLFPETSTVLMKRVIIKLLFDLAFQY